MANALGPYYGEFLFSPVPLEVSLVEPCDYACCYCFAVLNDRYWASKKGKSLNAHSTKSVLNLLSTYRTRKTLEARLLTEGYPVLLSNRTDPFGRKNRAATLPVIEILSELGIPMAFQTKGFIHPGDFEQVMSLLKPSWFYVSIAFADDASAKAIEPGAPSIEARFELITALRERGHQVSVGVNPAVPEWIGDPEPFLERIKDAGAYGTFAATLHLSKDQLDLMSDREKDAITGDIVARARKRRSPDIEFVEQLTDMALDMGLESSCEGFSGYTRFWEYAHGCYDKTFPTNQDFINACFETLSAGELVGFDDYADVMLPMLPEGVLSVGHYIGSSSRTITREMAGKWTNYFTYRELLQWYWREPRLGLSPVNNGCLSYAAKRDGDGVTQYVDSAGAPLMVFLPELARSLYTDPDTLEPIL